MFQNKKIGRVNFGYWNPDNPIPGLNYLIPQNNQNLKTEKAKKKAAHSGSSFFISSIRRSDLALDLNLFVGFDDIAYLDVIEIIDIQTTFIAGGNLFHIILEPFQGSQFARVDHHSVTDDTDIVVSVDLAIQYHTTGDGTHLADLERFPDLHIGHDLFFEFRRVHSLNG